MVLDRSGEKRMNKTLGYHRDMCMIVFGEGSLATKYLNEKIAEQGESEEVLMEESQLIRLLTSLHFENDVEFYTKKLKLALDANVS